MSIRYWKRCRRCFKYFDLGINEDLCPKCRKEENEVKEVKEWENVGIVEKT